MSTGSRFLAEFSGAAQRSGHLSQVERELAAVAARATARAPAAIAGRKQSRQVDESLRIKVHSNQRENTLLLRHIRHVHYDFGDILPDFDVGGGTGVLYLSLRFHSRKPEYIITRIKALRREFRLRILLVLVDVQDNERPILELTEMCIVNEVTMLLAWSPKEAARYIETFKLYERRTADAIRERPEGAYPDQVVDVLTSVRSVNRTDAASVVGALRSVAAVFRASPDQVARVPGFGVRKAQQLHDVLHAPIGRAPAPR